MTFLFTTWEGGGNMPPTLTAVRKLVTGGHDVRVMSDECNRAEAEAVGARFVPWTAAPSRPDKSVESDVVGDWGLPGPDGMTRTIEAILGGPAAAYAADVLAELDREPPDLVVTSEMLWGVLAACEAAGQRVAVLSANLSLVPIPGVPPMGPGLPPARDDVERAMHAEIGAAGARLFDDAGLEPLNAARRDLRLPPLTNVLDQYEVAAAYLLGTSAAFDFPATELPPRMRYVGPQLGTPAWAEPWSSPWPAADAHPLVLVAFSTTFQDHANVLQRTVDALGRFPVRVVVTLGPGLGPDAIAPAANTHVVASAPHEPILREAALVVTHGGHGTVINALVHGVPQLLIPHGRDQRDNAIRVVARGAGLQLEADVTAGELAGAIETLLADPSYREAARRLGAQIAADVEASPLLAELEALARHPADAGNGARSQETREGLPA